MQNRLTVRHAVSRFCCVHRKAGQISAYALSLCVRFKIKEAIAESKVAHCAVSFLKDG